MRRTIFLLVTLWAAFLLAGGVALVSIVGLYDPTVAEAQTKDAEKTTGAEKTTDAQNSQSETVRGFFHIQWGDPSRRDPNAEAKTEYVLLDDRGQEKKLLLDERDAKAVGGPQAFNGKRVEVRGTRVSDGPEGIDVEAIAFERPTDAAKAKSRIQSGEPAAEALASEGSTSKPWVTIGCKFKSSTEPLKARSYYDGLMGSSEPGMDDYWRELSSDKVNLTGSQVGGINADGTAHQFWYTLPYSKKSYMNGSNPNLTKIVNDCTKVADQYVKFSNFFGINLVLSDSIGCCSWGGSRTLSLDGQSKNYGVTWLPQTFASGHDWMAHEMGHGFGMPHSSGPYSATYDSEWDVMSGAGLCGADPSTPDNWVTHDPYECIADHTISYHKDLVGWIPTERRYVAASGSDQTITIERLGKGLEDPAPTSNDYYLMAKIPFPGSTTKFYTVEARRFAGYDNHINGRIPGEAIVIHKVDTSLSSRNAKVVDPDNDGDPNDEGAMWLPNDERNGTFTDATNGITVQVTEATEGGYKVRIKR